MEWLNNLLFNSGVAHTVLVYAFVISLGVLTGKIKIFGISLGATFVLFVGILVSHFGFRVDGHLIHFIKEFGLILFVYSIGLQVGPGFFSAFKGGGIKLNLLAMGIILLGVLLTIAFYFFGVAEMPIMVGIMSGAVTNTPGLGAATQAYKQVMEAVGQTADGSIIGAAYAVAYPLAIVGIILSIIVMRIIFRIDLEEEGKKLLENDTDKEQPNYLTIELTNDSIDGASLHNIKKMINRDFVASRMFRNNEYSIPQTETVLHKGDLLRVVMSPIDEEAILAFFGKKVEHDWRPSEKQLVSRRIVVTQSKINGKTLEELRLRTAYNVNVTRINRAGIDLLGAKKLSLQVGDRITVVGELNAIKKVESLMGNTLKKLNEPPLITIFIGVFLGILLGSIPVFLPGVPMPVKLGLAGGPLIVAILIGRFGYKFKLTTYTTQSANLMIRELGITLFLASVGLGAGEKFVQTVVDNGLSWIGVGFLITVIPLLIIGIVGRKVMKLNYFTLIGVMAGSVTDPPALAYSTSISTNDEPAVAYSTVYPLTMFLRILAAQLLILLFV